MSSALRSRSPQSLKVVKISPAFGPCPEKLKPRIETVFSTSGMAAYIWVAAASTWSVRFELAAGGVCTSVMMKPWSSFGRKLVGRRRKPKAVAPTSTR